MPIYEYACRACGRRFERMRKADDRLDPPECPQCTATQTVLVMSAPAKVGAGASVSSAPSCEGGFGGCCGGGACLN